MGGGPGVNTVPQRLRHLRPVHVKRAHIHRMHGKFVRVAVTERVAHLETPRRDVGHAGGRWIGGEATGAQQGQTKTCKAFFMGGGEERDGRLQNSGTSASPKGSQARGIDAAETWM